MNIKLVLRLVGRVMAAESFALFFPMAVALLYRESPVPFLLSILIILAISLPLASMRTEKHFFLREGFVSVGLIWLVTGVVGGLPFYFSGYFESFVDCIFETCSGFTTTGATILVDIEALPRGILFWRSFTHWLGGMGVLVLATAVLPSMGIRSHYLTQAETPGPVFSKLVPKQSTTSKILYSIYFGLTVVETVLLKIAGMPWYDAVIHALSSAGTGGFSNRNASVGAYGSVAIDLIITVFILLFSVNFAVYFLLLTRKFRDILASDELRFFLLAVALSSVIIFVNILPMYDSAGRALRDTLFQVASVVSTTGFSTADFALWPTLSQFILVLLMFLGGCAGSTAGGLKASRVLLMIRCAHRSLSRLSHPRVVKVVKLDGKAVDEDTLNTVFVFFTCFFLVLGGTCLVVSLDGFSLTTSCSAALACLSNIGPGLEAVGPMGNFAAFSGLSKLTLSLAMLIGRLEIFPILILLQPATWRRN
mgnify:CR=1 FL=1